MQYIFGHGPNKDFLQSTLYLLEHSTSEMYNCLDTNPCPNLTRNTSHKTVQYNMIQRTNIYMS